MGNYEMEAKIKEKLNEKRQNWKTKPEVDTELASN